MERWGWERRGHSLFRKPLYLFLLPVYIGGQGGEMKSREAGREERKDSLKFGDAFYAHGLSSCDIQILGLL